MKKRVCGILMMGCCMLTACSEVEDMTPEEAFCQYEEIQQQFQQDISFFSSTFQEYPRKQIDLFFASPESTPFVGQGLLKIDSISSGDQRNSQWEFIMKYQDMMKRIPVNINTLFTLVDSGNQSFLNIQDLNVFKGTGNIDNQVMEMITQELVDKWIEVENTGGIVEIVHNIQIPVEGLSLFTLTEKDFFQRIYQKEGSGGMEMLQTPKVLDAENRNSNEETKIKSGSEEIMIAKENIIRTIVKKLFQYWDLPSFSTIQLQPDFFYIPLKKGIEMVQQYRVITDTHSLIMEILLSPQKAQIGIYGIKDNEREEDVDKEFWITIERERLKYINVRFYEESYRQKVFEGNISFNTKDLKKIRLQGIIQDYSAYLRDDSHLLFNIEGEIRLSDQKREQSYPENIQFLP